MINEHVRDRAAKWIAGDILMASNPGEAFRRWRELIGMSQTALGRALGISPSVISDYETGRRKSPGVVILKRIIGAFLKADEEQGGKVLLTIAHMFGPRPSSDAVLDIREFRKPVSGKTIYKAVDGEVAANKKLLNKKLFGYTVIDSYKAVLELHPEDFRRLYGMTAERALVFTGVTMGRSPMVAVKVMGITPGMIVFHGSLKQVDAVGVKIAELLRVPLVVSKLPSVGDLLENLRKCAS